jgi:hypothetical protein
MDDEAVLAGKQAFIRAELRRFKTVEVKCHPLATSVLEAVFSRGDRRLVPVLLEAWRRGARFDGWDDKLDAAAWNGAFAAVGIDRREYLSPLPVEAPLPWDVVETGLRKSLLVRELEAALRGERTPGCLERSCAACDGCDLRSWKRRRRPASVAPPRPPARPAGEAVEGVERYRATYSKRGKARYLSHIDHISVIQRAFRRAGIEVRKTQGFHPKMDFTYGPALPLGTEACREVLEFRAARRLEETEFLRRVNRSLPAGLRFSRLERLAAGSPSLANSIERLDYSLDWKSAGSGRVATAAALEEALQRFKGSMPGAAAIGFSFRGRRLVLSLAPLPTRGVRVQDIVRDVLGAGESAAFLIRRDAVVLKN